ncbi:response regulator [Pseudomonas sp. NPDC007930]|uniref:response regulator n=1 Tax=Pseudomonas sp. NPDC007930 TaxID=3364417 RepID=UPI0036F16E5A
MYTAMIVDDHPFIRASVSLLLEQQRVHVVAEAESGREAVQLAREHRPDLAIVDLSMPQLDGLAAIQRLKLLDLPMRILVLTSQPAEFYSIRCMRAGAMGYVSKRDDLAELRNAVQAVLGGFHYFPNVTHSSVNRHEMRSNERELLASLSDRELMVLHHLARGFNNKDTAANLALSIKTVSSYKHRLLTKLKVSSLVALADIAKRHALS